MKYPTITIQEIIDGGYYDAAVETMDDDLREELCNDLAPCSMGEFLRAYVDACPGRFGEPFLFDNFIVI